MAHVMEYYDAPTDTWVEVTGVDLINVGGGITLNVFNGLTEPTGKDGVWFKTEDEIASSIIVARTPSRDGTWSYDDTTPYPNPSMNIIVKDGKLYCIGAGGTTSYRKYVRIRDLATGVWSFGADVPDPSYGYFAAELDGKIYVCGGYTRNNTSIYDIATNTWTAGTNMLNYQAYDVGGAIGSKLYAYGGASSSRNREYNIVTNTWTLKTNVPNNVSGMCGCICAGKGYAIGGAGQLTTVRRYDSATNTWTADNTFTANGKDMVCAPIEDKIYLFGGDDDVGDVNNRVVVYSTGSGECEILDDMTDGITNMCAGSDGAQKVYVLGSSTRYRVLTLEGNDYEDGTAVLLQGRIIGVFESRTAKLADIIEIFVEDAWIAEGGQLINYETYVGNGTTWTKIKDAS